MLTFVTTLLLLFNIMCSMCAPRFYFAVKINKKRPYTFILTRISRMNYESTRCNLSSKSRNYVFSCLLNLKMFKASKFYASFLITRVVSAESKYCKVKKNFSINLPKFAIIFFPSCRYRVSLSAGHLNFKLQTKLHRGL